MWQFIKIAKESVLDFSDDIPVLTKGQESQGLEVSASGQPLPGMNIVAGYAYTLAKVSLWYTSTPLHTFNDNGSVRLQISAKNIFKRKILCGQVAVTYE